MSTACVIVIGNEILMLKRRIHVTEFQNGQMEVFPVSRDGLPLWDGRKREGLSL